MRFWIFSSLGECSKESKAEARSEVFTIFLTSMVPVWLGALLATMYSDYTSGLGIISKFLNGNEALLFCAALLGPMAYTLTKSYGRSNGKTTLRFPHSLFFLLTLLVVYTIATSSFAFDFAIGENKPITTVDGSRKLFWYSIFFLGISFCVLYVAFVLRNNLPSDPALEMSRQDESFLKDWGNR